MDHWGADMVLRLALYFYGGFIMGACFSECRECKKAEPNVEWIECPYCGSDDISFDYDIDEKEGEGEDYEEDEYEEEDDEGYF